MAHVLHIEQKVHQTRKYWCLKGVQGLNVSAPNTVMLNSRACKMLIPTTEVSKLWLRPCCLSDLMCCDTIERILKCSPVMVWEKARNRQFPSPGTLLPCRRTTSWLLPLALKKSAYPVIGMAVAASPQSLGRIAADGKLQVPHFFYTWNPPLSPAVVHLS